MFYVYLKKCNELQLQRWFWFEKYNINSVSVHNKSQIVIMLGVNLLIVGCVLILNCEGKVLLFVLNSYYKFK